MNIDHNRPKYQMEDQIQYREAENQAPSPITSQDVYFTYQ